MQIATLTELKRELGTYSDQDLIKIILRLAKHKKEVKELLHYLCFEAQDQDAYIAVIKEEVVEAFGEVPVANMYRAKTRIRKILRTLNKYIRFSGEKATEAELRIFFCQQLLESDLPFTHSRVLLNLYERQVAAAAKAIDKLHPDLQYDFQMDYQALVDAV